MNNKNSKNKTMKHRLNFNKVDPGAYKAMDALEDYVSNTSIDAKQQELIRIRASQINGCAYCVDMHSRDARKAGNSEQRVFLVSAWREAGPVFTEEERLLLKMTEEITLIHQHGLSAATYEQAISIFGEQKTAQVIMIIITINAWNRIGVSVEMKPALQKTEAIV
jgi:AhpD family alkylhydroperoxidase